MLRFHPIANAKAAQSYYSQSDAGYYLGGSDLRREWVGKAAAMLGLSGTPDIEQFHRLIHGFDPNTGQQLTAKLVDHRIPAWDVTASIPKGVTVALERGDTRIQDVLWQAVRETVADLEQYATTRIRKGGKQDDRRTGNLIGFAVEHPETRPAKEDGMPDPDRHIHVVVFNLTYDATEKQWKAVKFRPIMEQRKFFDRRFDMRFASKLTDLGYSIQTKSKLDSSDKRRYYSWDIDGIPSSVIAKFSRRTGEVEKLAAELGIDDPIARDKLGSTSRQRKRKDMTLADCRAYWDQRLGSEESRQIAKTIEAAVQGDNPYPANTVEKGVRFAIAHHFERNSVLDWHQLATTAMERSMGGALPEEIEPEVRRQGVLFRDGLVTTREVLAEEQRIVGFAQTGRGTYQPMGPARADKAALDGLSADQRAVVRHIWQSPDAVILIEGDAGTGKTDTMKATIPGIDKHGVFLAPSASASRGTLREKGFTNADTVARFLVDAQFREQARDGFVYVDEAPLTGLRDIDNVFKLADALNARVILQGDRKQHKSVQRGNLFEILDRYAGLPMGRLTKNWRQQHDGYRDAVDTLARGDLLGGFDKLDQLGWVKTNPEHDPHQLLVADYLEAVAAGQSVLVVAPTHREGERITALLRTELKRLGSLSLEDHVFDQLRSLGWTEAEKGDIEHYEGTEVLQFHRKSGTFQAGERVRVADWKPGDRTGSPTNFTVYVPDQLAVATGDVIRITANGKTHDQKHRLNNGATYTVAGFDTQGRIRLNNGWVLPKDFAHFTHGVVATSHASQGRTVDRVLIALGRESQPAINAEQFYVSASRGQKGATIYSDLPAAQLREVIQKHDHRKSAIELFSPPDAFDKRRPRSFLTRVREAYVWLRDRAADAIREATLAKERERYGR
ncbi:MAG: relaxase domain-containing protein [Planctomycetes bacterium]|nr:relaxase domain-containing protein [Planctomycetota bacterium]